MVLTCLLFVVLFFYNLNLYQRSLHMLQQNLYNENNRYLNWVRANSSLVLNLNWYGMLFGIMLFFSNHEYLEVFFLIVMMLVYIVSYYYDRKRRGTDQNKKPFVVTARVKRLITTLSIIYAIPMIVFIINNDCRNIVILWYAVFTSFNFYLVYMVNIINKPVERRVYKHFENMARNKLASMNNLKVVGITGSYGKTSSKNILNEILNIKFNSKTTAKSLNTFYGLMITINNNLDKFDEVFIAEMGAYVQGEIHGLCELVKPKYGIITSIGTAHLNTFGSEENILNGKMELIEYLPSDGVGVLNKDDFKQAGYKVKNDCKILWIGIDSDDVDVRASNIKCNAEGTSFDVKFKGDKTSYKFETRLLGKHNVYNILDALALGYEFGISPKDLIQAVRRVKPTEHRLELKKVGRINMIDDAFNSNPVGAKSALDVLSMMKGKKVVVTPGMVELGEKEDEYNMVFGEQISKVADMVILIGEKKTKPIKKGLKNKKYDDKKILVINNVKEAFKILEEIKGKEEVYALFENDLPDTYTEK